FEQNRNNFRLSLGRNCCSVFKGGSLLSLDADLLMFSMRAHNRTCDLRVHLLKEASYELPLVDKVDLGTSISGTTWKSAAFA
ncbi:hypothetical protein NDU88_006151, partial [Pleurodeles waltl]